MIKASPSAQFFYDLNWAILRAAHRPGRARRYLFRFLYALTGPLYSSVLRSNPIVRASLWERRLYMQANHHLPSIVNANPMWSLPLVHAVQALGKENVQVIDIGANIGDTVALLEFRLPGVCNYLCIEPDDSFHKLCALNTSENPRVVLHKLFVADTGLSELVIEHYVPGSATTKISSAAGGGQTARTLDDVVAMAQDASVDFIKIDTDGFDYKVLRSGTNALRKQRPLLFFEWDPKLWEAQGERPLEVFSFLDQLGYPCVALFDDTGFFHATYSLPSCTPLESLCGATLARRGIDNPYFDVLAGPPEICKKAAELNNDAARDLAGRIQAWNRMQPVYWA